MDPIKQKRLEAAGWSIGSTADFLELSEEESAIVELKLALSNSLKRRREKQKISQKRLAQRMQSSQSRVAKMEAGDPSVSIELLIKGLFCVGATFGDIAEVVASAEISNQKCSSLASKELQPI